MTRLKVEGFQETLHDSMCGPASLKIVLGYLGMEKEEQELAELVGKTDLGTNDTGIKSAAEALGFKVVVKNESSFDDIQEWLDKDVPVIVNWFTRGRSDYSDSDVADGHYSVVTGLDEHNIYLQDPEIGETRTISRDDFMRVWFDFSGETIKPNELIIRQLIAIYR
jgi:ABC-type bacteriocin/lantibiotic exporter with double-glycine peptidase domain